MATGQEGACLLSSYMIGCSYQSVQMATNTILWILRSDGPFYRRLRSATLDHTWDEQRAALKASRSEASSRADGLTPELVQARSYIHSTLSMEQGREGDEPSEIQRAFCHLHSKLAKSKEALRVATIEAGTLQALLKTKRQSSTSDPTMERELVRLQHSHDRLRELAKDMGFDATGLLRIYAQDDPILRTGFGRLCQAVSDRLSHI